MEEEVLSDGGVTHVVRVGSTVRRPVRPFTATVHAYLAHVRSRGFLECPEPLGVDGAGREVLTFVEGDVPDDPLPALVADPAVPAALGALVRRLHDAAADWVPPPGAVFGSIPGARPAWAAAPPGAGEIVAHQDYCPGNVVFRGGIPAALIDFDLARPTTRVADLVNAIGWWAPLAAPVDRAPALAGADAVARARVLVDAYGLDPGRRAQVVDVALWRADANLVGMRAAADVDPVFRRWWDAGLEARLLRGRDWLAAQALRLHAALVD